MLPIEIDDERGAVLQDDFVNGNLEIKIKINDSAFLSSNIKGVDKVSGATGRQDEVNTKLRSDVDRDYNAMHKSIRSLPPAERAKSLRVAEMMWYGLTGESEMPPSVVPKIVKAQEKYFKENPNHVYANPICYKKLIPKKAEPKMPLGMGMRGFALRLVERLIAADNKVAKYL